MEPTSQPAPAPALAPYFPSPSRATLHRQAGTAFLLQAAIQEALNRDYRSQENMDFSSDSCNLTLTFLWLREERGGFCSKSVKKLLVINSSIFRRLCLILCLLLYECDS